MRKADFDHVIAVAAALTDESEIVVIGSQAILGSVEDPPAAMLRSLETDLYPRDRPERADEIDGTLGDGSRFQATFGYYAHGVGPETAKAPAGWEDRLVRVEMPRLLAEVEAMPLDARRREHVRAMLEARQPLAEPAR